MSRRSLLIIGTITAALSLFACAGPTEDDGASDPSTSEAAVSDVNPITVGNFLTHPRIVAVRDLVDEIDRGAREGTFIKSRREGLCSDSHGDDVREKYVDSSGRVGKLVIGAGSDDSYGTTTLYYDAERKLRFAFEFSGNVHGHVNEVRVYFDAAGNRIFEAHRTTLGDGDIVSKRHTIPAAGEELTLTRDQQHKPAAVYAAPASCN